MFCGSCRAEFEKEPLKIYNGELYCPICLEGLFPRAELEITFENARKYTESEKLFHEKWLLKQNMVALKLALNLCREAACQKNPYATVAMGYYHEKNYLNPYASEIETVRNAYKYYEAVAVYDAEYRSAFPSARVIEEKMFADSAGQKALCGTAIQNIYCLLRDASEEACKGLLKISQSEALERLEKISGLTSERTAMPKFREREIFPGAEQFVLKLKTDNVLFGIQKVDAAFLTALVEFEGKGETKEIDGSNMIQKLNSMMWLFFKNADKSLGSIEVGSQAQLKKAVKDNHSECYLAYFKNSFREVTYKKGKKKVTVRAKKEVFKSCAGSLIVNGMLYDFRKADIMIACEAARKAGRDMDKDKLFLSALDTLYKGDL